MIPRDFQGISAAVKAMRLAHAPDPRRAGFYKSKGWIDTRARHLKRHPRCNRCKIIPRRKIVHHKIPVKENPRLALSRSNLETLCHPCHNAVEFEKRTRYKRSGWRK